MGTGFDWSVVLDVGVGVGVFAFGMAVLWIAAALVRTLRRVDATLDEVDQQIAALGKPVGETLAHVGGIADTADQVIARLTGIVGSLESVTSSLAETSKLVQDSVSPAIVNVGSAIGGITAGLRRIVRGNGTGDEA